MQQRAAISGATRTGGGRLPSGLGHSSLGTSALLSSLSVIPRPPCHLHGCEWVSHCLHLLWLLCDQQHCNKICGGQNFLIVKLRKPTDQMNSYSNTVSWEQGFWLFIMWLSPELKCPPEKIDSSGPDSQGP